MRASVWNFGGGFVALCLYAAFFYGLVYFGLGPLASVPISIICAIFFQLIALELVDNAPPLTFDGVLTLLLMPAVLCIAVTSKTEGDLDAESWKPLALCLAASFFFLVVFYGAALYLGTGSLILVLKALSASLGALAFQIVVAALLPREKSGRVSA